MPILKPLTIWTETFLKELWMNNIFEAQRKRWNMDIHYPNKTSVFNGCVKSNRMEIPNADIKIKIIPDATRVRSKSPDKIKICVTFYT